MTMEEAARLMVLKAALEPRTSMVEEVEAVVVMLVVVKLPSYPMPATAVELHIPA